MKEILMALAVVLSINMFFYFGQLAVDNLNPNGQTFYNYSNSWLYKDNLGNYTLQSNLTSQLPNSPSIVSAGDTNFFTDIFASFSEWIKGITGLRYLENMVNAVPNFLKSLGLPVEISYGLGWFWHVFVFFITLMFLKGDT